MAPSPDTNVPQEDNRLGPDELAAEYLDRMAAGAQPDVRTFLERLSTADERRELLELLRFAVKVQDVLPKGISAGDRIGQYELTEELDSGGMGRVFLAFDLLLEREVAVKVLLPTITSSAFRRRFHEECKFLAQLNHPNIVAVHDAGFHGDVSYLYDSVTEEITNYEQTRDYVRITVEQRDLLVTAVRAYERHMRAETGSFSPQPFPFSQAPALAPLLEETP